MIIQFFRRSDNTSFAYLCDSIIPILKSLGHQVFVKSVDKKIEGEKLCRSHLAILYGLIPDVKWLSTSHIKIAGLVCEQELTKREIEIIKKANLDEIWLPSQFVIEKFQKVGFVNNLALIPHGIPRIEPIKKKEQTNKISMIFSSYENPCFNVQRKGIFEVLEAWTKYKIDKKLILRTVKRSYYDNFDLTNVIFREERLTDLKEIFEESDAILCPSYCEGFGIVGLESFAYGVPLISSKTGNDYLNGNSYIHIDLPITPEKICNSINDLYLGLQEYKDIALNQAPIVYEKYKWESFCGLISKRISVITSKQK